MVNYKVITKKQDREIKRLEGLLAIMGISVESLKEMVLKRQLEALECKLEEKITSLETKVDEMVDDVTTIKRNNEEKAREQQEEIEKTQKWLFEQEEVK